MQTQEKTVADHVLDFLLQASTEHGPIVLIITLCFLVIVLMIRMLGVFEAIIKFSEVLRWKKSGPTDSPKSGVLSGIASRIAHRISPRRSLEKERKRIIEEESQNSS